jgi:hypothetical protein
MRHVETLMNASISFLDIKCRVLGCSLDLRYVTVSEITRRRVVRGASGINNIQAVWLEFGFERKSIYNNVNRF